MSIHVQRILLPTDFSENSKNAESYACELADQFGAELHLLHVLELHISSTPTFGAGLAVNPPSRESQTAAQSQLARLLDPQWVEGRAVVRATAHGAPFLEIVRYAKANDIDLIVMGTHGGSGLSQILLGSVAERVVRKAPCPVLTIRPQEHEFVMP